MAPRPTLPVSYPFVSCLEFLKAQLALVYPCSLVSGINGLSMPLDMEFGLLGTVFRPFLVDC